MSNYYTKTIPDNLARALKEKGIHSLRDARMEGWLNSGDNITYAEVFDWFMSKGVCICMTCTRRAFRMALGYGYVVQNIDKFYASEGYSRTWVHAAIRAIGQAIELIEAD